MLGAGFHLSLPRVIGPLTRNLVLHENSFSLPGNGIITLSLEFLKLPFVSCFCFLFAAVVSSRHSTVGIRARHGLHDRGVGVRVPVGARIFSNE
jgi:hypothetical protein